MIPRLRYREGIMRVKDSRTSYGLVTWALHWVMGLAIIAVFGLGLWMVELDYYSPYYTLAPDIHRSVGMLLLFALGIRFVWRIINPKPSSEELSPLERLSSNIVHWGFYPLLAALLISGYLISSADGKPVSVFGWFNVPATLTGPGQETTAGNIHWALAWLVIAITAIHALAALKHHFWDKSRILSRMWSGPFTRNQQ